MLFYETKFVLICSRNTMKMMQMSSKSSSFFCLHLPLPRVEIYFTTAFSSVQFSSVSKSTACQASLSITNSRVYSNSCPSSRWCHPAIWSSVIPFSSCPQSLPASGSFPMSQLFTSGGQSTGVSAPALVLPMNTQDWSPSEWTGWISLQSTGLSRVFSNTTV